MWIMLDFCICLNWENGWCGALVKSWYSWTQVAMSVRVSTLMWEEGKILREWSISAMLIVASEPDTPVLASSEICRDLQNGNFIWILTRLNILMSPGQFYSVIGKTGAFFSSYFLKNATLQCFLEEAVFTLLLSSWKLCLESRELSLLKLELPAGDRASQDT